MIVSQMYILFRYISIGGQAIGRLRKVRDISQCQLRVPCCKLLPKIKLTLVYPFLNFEIINMFQKVKVLLILKNNYGKANSQGR